MKQHTFQEQTWNSNFGEEYTNRNILTPDEVDILNMKNFGCSRTQIYRKFLGKKELNRVFEVGCNAGNQLNLLKKMGYNNLWGMELQDYAVEFARINTQEINIVQGTAFDIPFKDGFFDLVFSAGVLIHIAPKDINAVLDEMYRCTSKYIMGSEYYHPDKYQMVNYRGNNDLLWKTDFSKLFLNRFPYLKLIQIKMLKYLNNNNMDIVYLLEKV